LNKGFGALRSAPFSFVGGLRIAGSTGREKTCKRISSSASGK
jgi:hypothetical protein